MSKGFVVSLMAISWLTACAFVVPMRKIDKDIQPYYDAFIENFTEICGNYNPPNLVNIHFTKLVSPNIGGCLSYPFGYTLDIDQEYWDLAPSSRRVQLVYHELSHCVLGKDHVDNPDNYMYSSLEDLPLETTLNQTRDNMHEFCKR